MNNDEFNAGYKAGKVEGFADGWDKGYDRGCMLMKSRHKEEIKALVEQYERELAKVRGQAQEWNKQPFWSDRATKFWRDC